MGTGLIMILGRHDTKIGQIFEFDVFEKQMKSKAACFFIPLERKKYNHK